MKIPNFYPYLVFALVSVAWAIEPTDAEIIRNLDFYSNMELVQTLDAENPVNPANPAGPANPSDETSGTSEPSGKVTHENL